MLIPAQVARGVTLIEMLIAVGILSVLLAAGTPSFNTWLQTSRIRTAAETIQTGLQLARTEAVRRNTPVQFVLGNGSSWTVGCVNVVADADGDGIDECPETIQARSESEGPPNAVVATSEVSGANNAAVNPAAFTDTLIFNGLGRIGAGLGGGNLAVFAMSNPTGGQCAPDGPMRCLRVEVSNAGQMRMCDPALAAADPRGC